MAGLKKYDYTTESGYTTTLLLTEEDAKVRGLVSQADAAKKEAASKAAADKKAKAEADAKAAEEAKKQAQAPQNKQAAAPTK
jgi:hypothetical protein